jgi:soluble lytic murein transglycosylase-like protein
MKSIKLAFHAGMLALALISCLANAPVAHGRFVTTTVYSQAVVEAQAREAKRLALLDAEQQALVDHLSAKYKKPEGLVKRIVSSAYTEAVKVGMSPLLILAIAMKESSLDPAARSGYGAVGLMQVVPRFHMEKMSANADPEVLLKRPEDNIRVGTTILAEYHVQQGGSLTSTLAKYSGKARGYAERVFKFRKELETVKARKPLLSA